MEDLRDSVQVQRGRVRGNTPEGAVFFSLLLHKSQACFLRGAFLGAGTFVVGRTDLLEVHYTGGGENGPLVRMLPP